LAGRLLQLCNWARDRKRAWNVASGSPKRCEGAPRLAPRVGLSTGIGLRRKPAQPHSGPWKPVRPQGHSMGLEIWRVLEGDRGGLLEPFLVRKAARRPIGKIAPGRSSSWPPPDDVPDPTPQVEAAFAQAVGRILDYADVGWRLEPTPSPYENVKDPATGRWKRALQGRVWRVALKGYAIAVLPDSSDD